MAATSASYVSDSFGNQVAQATVGQNKAASRVIRVKPGDPSANEVSRAGASAAVRAGTQHGEAVRAIVSAYRSRGAARYEARTRGGH